MLEIKKELVNKDYTSCNFCNRGELSKARVGLVYPYNEVITICREGGGIKISICEECLNELNKSVEKNGYFNKQ